jgi:hypothetical protein
MSLIKLPKDVFVGEVSIDLHQDADCCQSGDMAQELKIRLIDGGGGPFFVLETQRWAFDDPNEIKAILDSIKEAFGATFYRIQPAYDPADVALRKAVIEKDQDEDTTTF